MGWAIARTQEFFASAIRLLRSLSLTESAAAISLDKKLLFSQSSLDKATCCKQRLSYACRFRRLTHAQSASPPWWCAVKPRGYGEIDSLFEIALASSGSRADMVRQIFV